MVYSPWVLCAKFDLSTGRRENSLLPVGALCEDRVHLVEGEFFPEIPLITACVA